MTKAREVKLRATLKQLMKNIKSIERDYRKLDRESNSTWIKIDNIERLLAEAYAEAENA